MATNQSNLTEDQRKDNLNHYDTLADGIITVSTGLGGFISLIAGLFLLFLALLLYTLRVIFKF